MIDRSTTIGDVMTPSPHTIGRDETLATAHHMLGRHAIRHLPVLAGGRLVGILSDRDLRLVESIRTVDPERLTVEEAMTPDPFTISPDERLCDVAAMMAEHRYGAVVIVKDAHVVGIFTAVDGLRHLAQTLIERTAEVS